MNRFAFGLILSVVTLCSWARAQEPQKAEDPRQGLPAPVKKAWEKFERQVEKNREIYDKANEKSLAGFQKELFKY